MSSSETSPLVPLLILPALPSTYGSLLVGVFFALMLQGFSLHQGYYYLRTYVRDPIYMKYYVVLIMVIDILHSADLMMICYKGLVSDFFKPLQVFQATWWYSVFSALTGLAICLCQAFFAYRVYKIHLRYKYYIAAGVLPVLLSMLGFSFAATIKAFHTSSWLDFVKDTWMIQVALCIALSLDTILTTVLIVALRRRRTAFQSTNSKLDALIAYAVCTGFLTDVINIVAFVLSKISPDDMRYTTLVLTVVKVYTNSVLAALNLRSPSGPYAERPSGNSKLNVAVAVELSKLPKAAADAGVPVPDCSYTDSSASVIDIKV